jgi:hypothetical protein
MTDPITPPPELSVQRFEFLPRVKVEEDVF